MVKHKKVTAPVVTTALLCLSLIAELAGVVAAVVQSGWPDLIPYDAATIQQGMLVTGVITLVLTMFWCSRVNRTLANRVHGELETGTGLAAFWFIIPIACYFKPYGVVLEIFKASRNPDDWRGDKNASIIGWWWGLYLVTNIAAVVSRIARTTGEGEMSELALSIGVIILVGLVLEHIFRLVIVARVLAWLSAKPKMKVEEVF